MAANAWAGGLGDDWGPAAQMAAVLPTVLAAVLPAVLAAVLAAVVAAVVSAVLAAGEAAPAAVVAALHGAGEEAAAGAPHLHLRVGALGFLKHNYCISSTFLIIMALLYSSMICKFEYVPDPV